MKKYNIYIEKICYRTVEAEIDVTEIENKYKERLDEIQSYNSIKDRNEALKILLISLISDGTLTINLEDKKPINKVTLKVDSIKSREIGTSKPIVDVDSWGDTFFGINIKEKC